MKRFVKRAAVGALALGLVGFGFGMSQAHANQTTGKVEQRWVHLQAVPTANEFGQPAIIYGINNFPTLSQCKKDIKSMAAQDGWHMDECEQWNYYDAGEAGDGSTD